MGQAPPRPDPPLLFPASLRAAGYGQQRAGRAREAGLAGPSGARSALPLAGDTVTLGVGRAWGQRALQINVARVGVCRMGLTTGCNLAASLERLEAPDDHGTGSDRARVGTRSP